MTFSQQGPGAVCILSATGVVCNVTLRQPSMGGGTGRFGIISLSGSFLLSESNGSRSRTGGLSVSLAGPDGRVLGGGVAGMLMAATPVQVPRATHPMRTVVALSATKGGPFGNAAQPMHAMPPTYWSQTM
ncbi:hypothetical protein RND71_018607 [Anisodus tanguticus]|uniref:AT-hook motif nuclear-localized protein n=1 Tax=Anisodus tanguticus TaxID=243964 RepID=A0AAE1S6G6_9SOLA|nr:hypothetical protein RND71_018607 [Anisodus tanguticus]